MPIDPLNPYKQLSTPSTGQQGSGGHANVVGEGSPWDTPRETTMKSPSKGSYWGQDDPFGGDYTRGWQESEFYSKEPWARQAGWMKYLATMGIGGGSSKGHEGAWWAKAPQTADARQETWQARGPDGRLREYKDLGGGRYQITEPHAYEMVGPRNPYGSSVRIEQYKPGEGPPSQAMNRQAPQWASGFGGNDGWPF